MKWSDKSVLCLGDSLTEAGVWTEQLRSNLGCKIITHCRGGLGMKEIVDGGESAVGKLGALTPEMINGKALIIFFAGYNDRGLADGHVGDCYPEKNTISGLLQYCINRIYSIMRESNNLDCRLLIVTPHCVGKYSYIPVDGYHEYPAGSGRTVRSLATAMCRVASYNSIPACNLWENSGINRCTWKEFANIPDEDEVHCSTTGYQRIGDVITGAVIGSYGI